MMNDGLMDGHQTGKIKGSFTSVLLMVLLLSIGFEYYKFWPDGSKKQTHSRISVSIATQAVITPRSALLLYFEFY